MKFIVCTVLTSSIFVSLLSCRSIQGKRTEETSEIQSEIDSFTPQSIEVDPEASKRAFQKLDEITRNYLKEAVDWANKQPDCNGYCFSMIVSETLAAAQPKSMVENKLADIREGKLYRRWGQIPPLPGWRGYFGAIEPLLSKGKTTDGRYTLDEGVIRLNLKESVFRNLNRLDSPGSFLEVGAILPVYKDNSEMPLFIGSDKFGHFLSTGYEYLETYKESYDDTFREGLSPAESEERAIFAVHVRGLLTEVTSLGGWIARVFSFGDLSANFDGFLFFKAIAEHKSPYFKYNKESKKWALSERPFTWHDLVRASWDEGQNCSHYFDSMQGTNDFAKKIVAQLVDLEKQFGRNFVCPSRVDLCQNFAKIYEQERGFEERKVLLSPQCLDIAVERKARISFKAEDAQLAREGLDQKGFYSGEKIVELSQEWCEEQRDTLTQKRCLANSPQSAQRAQCPATFKKVTVEKFRCKFDTQDFLGWAT